MHKNRSGPARLGVAVAMALLLASCGDSDSGSSDVDTSEAAQTSEAATETTAADDTVATETGGDDGTDTEAAAGEAVQIGFVNQEGGVLAFPDIGDGARAAVQYINNDLGGLEGRPIELVECSTEMSPESSASCANQMVEAGVPLVLNGIDLANSSLHPILDAAGIPLIGQEPFTAEDYQNGFFFGGSSAAYILGSSVFIRDVLEADTVSYLVYPGAAPEGAVQTFAVPAFENAGIDHRSTILDPALPDFTPVVAAAIADDPDVLIGFFQEPDCTKVVQTAKQLGYEGDIVAGACGAFATDAGADAEGVYSLGDIYSVDDPEAAPAEAQAELEIYTTALAEYAPSRTPGVFTQITFASVMNVYSLLQDIGADDITSDSVIEALRSTRDRPGFMTTPFTCDGSVNPSTPSVCRADVLVFQVEDGKFSQVSDWLFGPDALN